MSFTFSSFSSFIGNDLCECSLPKNFMEISPIRDHENGGGKGDE